jgi:hypothetical protein
VLILLAIIYVLSARAVFRDYTGGFTAMSFNAYKIQEHDFLLARYSAARQPVQRGTLVIANISELYNYQVRRQRTFPVVGQIVAVSGDRVEIKGKNYVVNGKELEMTKFPVPNWLHNVPISLTIPDGSYFFSAEFTVGGHGNLNLLQAAGNACVIDRTQVAAKVIMRWLPLKRRGYISETP